MMASSLNQSPETLYDLDFYEWVNTNVRHMREQRFDMVDFVNVIDEIESLGRGQRDGLEKYLRILLINLLKWQFHPTQRSRYWEHNILSARIELKRFVRYSPSLMQKFEDCLATAYKEASQLVNNEDHLPDIQPPAQCLYTKTQILDAKWLPA